MGRKDLAENCLLNLLKSKNMVENRNSIKIELNCVNGTSLSVPSKKMAYERKEIPIILENI
jgi:hypothetical protein